MCGRVLSMVDWQINIKTIFQKTNKIFKKISKDFREKSRKLTKFQKSFLGNAKKRGMKRLIWHVSDSILGWNEFIFEKDEKKLKNLKKLSKKVLTNGNIYDILHERSTEERQKQRSLKIEQQQTRMN